MNEQIRNFEEVTLLELQDRLRNKSTNILDGYLFLVASGNNDFLLNYLIQPQFARPTVPAFVAKLISTYASQLQVRICVFQVSTDKAFESSNNVSEY